MGDGKLLFWGIYLIYGYFILEICQVSASESSVRGYESML